MTGSHSILFQSLLLAYCLNIISCAGGNTEQIPPAASAKPALQAIHSGDIRAIMRRLNAHVHEREYTQLELDQLRRRNLEKLAGLAAELVAVSDNLPGVLPDIQLTTEEQTTFRVMASQLHNETMQLLNAGMHIPYQELNDGYRRLQQTCAACHNLFRESR